MLIIKPYLCFNNKGTIIFFKLVKLKKLLRNTLKFLLPLALGVGIFYSLYRNLDTDEMVNILKTKINYSLIIVSMLIGLLSHVARAVRWRLQLQVLGENPSMRTLTNAIFGMYAMNLLFPRLGEVWRCTYIARRQRMSFAQVLGSVFSDRLSDSITVLLLTIVVFFLQMSVFKEFLTKFPMIVSTWQSLVSSPWLYLCIGGLVGFLIWLFRKKTENKYILKIKTMVANLWLGFNSVLKMKQGYKFVLYTLLIWSCYFLQLYVCLLAFPETVHLGVRAALALFIMGSIGMSIPVQGGLGPWHLAVIATLSLYGVGEPVSKVFALVAHGSQMLLIVLLGIYTLFSIALEKKADVPERAE